VKKINLTPFDWGLVAAFGLTAVIGIVGYLYTSSMLDTAKQELGNENSRLQQLTTGRRYRPSEVNIKALEENNKRLEAMLQPIVEQMVKESEKISKVTEKDPVLFKQDVTDTVKRLTDQAKAKNVEIPANFAFTFGRYQQTNPTKEATLNLGKQLVGIEALSQLVYGAGIRKLIALRRTFDEDVASGGSGAGSSAESLPLKIVRGESGFYTVYPLEVEFECAPLELKAFLEGVAKAPNIFVIRSIQSTNSTTVPKLADLNKDAGSGGEGAAQGSARPEGRPPKTIIGNELIRVKVRIDLVEWTKPEGAEMAQKK
jgi:hypothetical protein